MCYVTDLSGQSVYLIPHSCVRSAPFHLLIGIIEITTTMGSVITHNQCSVSLLTLRSIIVATIGSGVNLYFNLTGVSLVLTGLGLATMYTSSRMSSIISGGSPSTYL